METVTDNTYVPGRKEMILKSPRQCRKGRGIGYVFIY